VNDLGELLRAFDRSSDSVMMLQEDVNWNRYVRCLVFGGEQVIVARYDPEYRQYLPDGDYLEADLEELLVHDAARLAKALGYDLCAREFAITDEGPVAMEFINPVPDFEVAIVTPFYFDKIVEAVAHMLLRFAKGGRVAANWPLRGKSGLSAWVSGPDSAVAATGKTAAAKKTVERTSKATKSVAKPKQSPTPAVPAQPAKRSRAPRKPPSTRARNKKA
jgi:hypothetical protein